jgi:predicted permease
MISRVAPNYTRQVLRAGFLACGTHVLRERFGRRPSLLQVVEGHPRAHDRLRHASKIGQMLQDIRQALRALAKRPSSAVLTVLVFTVAIGANTTVFGVFNGFFLRPMPFPDDGLVMMYESLPKIGVDDVGTSLRAYLALRAQASGLEDAAIFAQADRSLPGEPAPERISVTLASPSLFNVLGVMPVLGRSFTEDEVVPGNERVVLLSHRLWTTRFGARADIVGEDLRLDDELFRIVGVMPEGFAFPDTRAAAWVPLAYTFAESGEPEEVDDSGVAGGVGRLQSGATLESLNGELDALARGIAERSPALAGFAESAGYTIRAEPLRDYFIGDLRQRLLVLQILVLAVLLIACANVANLQLARLAARRKELAVRAALGAGTGRLARLVVLESVLLALAGAGVGLAFARGGVELVRVLGLERADDGFELKLDATVLAATFGAALVAALLSALLPLCVLRREDLARGVQEAGRGSTAGMATRRWRSGLVVVQLAAGVALLAGAGLLTRSFYELLREGPGFEPTGVWSAAVQFPNAPRYADDAARARFFEDALAELRSLPGVANVGFTTMLPFVSSDYGATINVDGHQLLDGSMAKVAQLHSIDHGYFAVLGIPVIRGRNFAASETDRVVIVDERFARAYWPDGNALGERLRNRAEPGNDDWHTIIGIVPPVKHNSFTGDEYEQTVYWHFAQRLPPEHTGMFVLRTALPVDGLTPAAAAAIAHVDPLVTLTDVQPMDARVSDALGPQRAPMVLTLVFAAIAVTLAVIGVYGVLAWGVAQRVGEIGLRMALGARASDVLRMIMKQGARMLVAGLVLGTAGALALGRVLAAQIPEVDAADPLVLAGAALTLTVAALAASWLPARRAARLDPIDALRRD